MAVMIANGASAKRTLSVMLRDSLMNYLVTCSPNSVSNGARSVPMLLAKFSHPPAISQSTPRQAALTFSAIQMRVRRERWTPYAESILNSGKHRTQSSHLNRALALFILHRTNVVDR